MVIGFDGSRAFAAERTGTENYSYQLLKALAKIDHKNTYIVYIRSSSVIPAKAGIHTNNYLWIPNQVGDDSKGWPNNFQFKEIKWPRLWTQIGLGWQTFKNPLDVLFVPAHTLPVIRRPGLKTVVTVHDLGSEYLPSMHQIKQRLYLGFMQNFQLKTATKIIAVSKATKKDLIERVGVDSKKIEVIYEGYDKDKFKNQKSKIKNDVLVNSPYFLFVGTVQPRKNLERLIEAFRIHLRGGDKKRKASSEQLIIAGSRGWMSDEIYGLPKKLGIEDRVKFLGYVPEKDLPALYSGAIALIFPSLFEGFGLPILEAQACGCPVITSDVSSMPEVAGPPAGGGAILVNPYSVDDIVEGMERLQVTGYRLQLIKKGLENTKRFSWEKCARETLEVLESL